MATPARVERSIAIDGGRRVVLYAAAATEPARAQNLVCLDRAGRRVWVGELPDGVGPDRFVAVERAGDALLAVTASGHRIALSAGTGRALR